MGKVRNYIKERLAAVNVAVSPEHIIISPVEETEFGSSALGYGDILLPVNMSRAKLHLNYILTY